MADIGIKEVLDWCVPIAITWVGSGIRKYAKAFRDELSGCKAELAEAKGSVIQLNINMAKVIDHVENHTEVLRDHEKRLRRTELKR